MTRWPTKPLEEIATLYGGSTPLRDNPSFWGGDIPWVTPTDLPMPGEGISVVSETRDRITQAGLDNSSATLVPKGTVLFSSRATIGKVAVADMPLATNQGFANFVPGPAITSRFLAYVLWTRRNDIARLAGSTTFKEVSRGSIRKYCIPIPPLDEQNRIVKRLDEADELRKLRAQADRRAADLIPAIFQDMFLKRTKYDRAKLEIVSERITKGESPNWQRFQYCNEGPTFITSENVRWGDLNLSDAKHIPLEFHRKLKRSALRSKDVLVNLVGASIGRSAIVPGDLGDANINQAVACITPLPELLPEFLCSFILSPETQQKLQGGKVEGARANISLTDLRELLIPLPELTEQKRFTTSATDVRTLQGNQNDSRHRLDRLFQSLLDKAFKGEL